MSRASAAGTRLEKRGARVLKTEHHVRSSYYESAPDMKPFWINGEQCQPECKQRKTLPVFLTKTLAQASKYTPGATPMAILRAKGQQPLVCLSLEAFARIAGIQPREVTPQTSFATPCSICSILTEVA